MRSAPRQLSRNVKLMATETICLFCEYPLPRIRGAVSSVNMNWEPETPRIECSAKKPSSQDHFPLDAYECSRVLGHRGEHVACGFHFHSVASWGNSDSSSLG